MKTLPVMEKLLEGVEVEWKALGDVFEMRAGQHISASKIEIAADDEYKFPCYGGNGLRGFVKSASHNGKFLLIGRQGALCGNVHRVSGEFYATEHAVVVTTSECVDVDWAFHLLTMMNLNQYASKSAQPGLAVGKIATLKIPIPPLNIQAEIVRILDAFTAYTAELTAELNARKKQYNHYRDQLLSFSDTEVEWKTLGEVALYSNTRVSAAEVNDANYVGVDNLLQNREGKKLSNYVPTEGNLTKFFPNDTLIGNIRPYLKKIWFSDCVGGTNGDVLVIRPFYEGLDAKYLYQVLADDKFFDYNMQHAKGAKMPRGNKDKIMGYSIPIPSLAEQARIVAILDKFDALTASISEGLPREIELRQQQYEYYRDRLLSFPRPE